MSFVSVSLSVCEMGMLLPAPFDLPALAHSMDPAVCPRFSTGNASGGGVTCCKSCWVQCGTWAIAPVPLPHLPRHRTLKDALEEHSLAPESLVALLSEELRAYKMVRADTGHERFNVICDLLELYPEESGQVQERAGVLLELAQVLCYHDYTEKTEW